LPWLTWNGRQALLFDLGTRKFYIFGLVLWPQDFIYLAALLIICAYLLFLATAIAGRVWCGFACRKRCTPKSSCGSSADRGHAQRPHGARRQPLAAQAPRRRPSTWPGARWRCGPALPSSATSRRSRNWRTVTTLNFGPWEWFWVCSTLCHLRQRRLDARAGVQIHVPYARFQSAMFDRDTLIITYDAKRGEPRGA
jgi:hypothetical protein